MILTCSTWAATIFFLIYNAFIIAVSYLTKYLSFQCILVLTTCIDYWLVFPFQYPFSRKKNYVFVRIIKKRGHFWPWFFPKPSFSYLYEYSGSLLPLKWEFGDKKFADIFTCPKKIHTELLVLKDNFQEQWTVGKIISGVSIVEFGQVKTGLVHLPSKNVDVSKTFSIRYFDINIFEKLSGFYMRATLALNGLKIE